MGRRINKTTSGKQDWFSIILPGVFGATHLQWTKLESRMPSGMNAAFVHLLSTPVDGATEGDDRGDLSSTDNHAVCNQHFKLIFKLNILHF